MKILPPDLRGLPGFIGLGSGAWSWHQRYPGVTRRTPACNSLERLANPPGHPSLRTRSPASGIGRSRIQIPQLSCQLRGNIDGSEAEISRHRLAAALSASVDPCPCITSGTSGTSGSSGSGSERHQKLGARPVPIILYSVHAGILPLVRCYTRPGHHNG